MKIKRTLDELFELVYNHPETESKVQIACENFVAAEIDWRTSSDNLEVFIDKVEKMIGGDSTKNNIIKLINKYEPFALNYAWELEYLTTLLNVFDYDKNKTLREIFNSICEDWKE